MIRKDFVLLLFIQTFFLSFAQAQQDTLYLKNKFNKNGNATIKDTTFMWGPLFYVDTLNQKPVTGVIIEKHRKGTRITHAKNGFTLKQKGVRKKYTDYIFHNPKSGNFVSMKIWKKKPKYNVIYITEGSNWKYASFHSNEAGELTMTIHRNEVAVTFQEMYDLILKALPEFESEFQEIFAEELKSNE